MCPPQLPVHFSLSFVRAELESQRFIKVNIQKSLKEHFSKQMIVVLIFLIAQQHDEHILL